MQNKNLQRQIPTYFIMAKIPFRGLFILWILVQSLHGRIPETGATAELGAERLFQGQESHRGWSATLGGGQPWSIHGYSNAFVQTSVALRNARIATGFSYSGLDSIYSSGQWEFGADARWRNFFVSALHGEELQMVPGFRKTWIHSTSGSLGYSLREQVAFAIGVSLETSCICSQIAIQWKLGHYYLMHWELKNNPDRSIGITFGQRLALASTFAVSTGISYPERIVGASLVFSTKSFTVDATQIWHPLLSPSRFTSLSWSQDD